MKESLKWAERFDCVQGAGLGLYSALTIYGLGWMVWVGP